MTTTVESDRAAEKAPTKRAARRKGIAWDGDPLDERAVGGKLARQRTMAAAGIRVPRFFCLTSEVFDDAFAPVRAEVRALLAGADFSQDASIRAAADRIRAIFEGLALPPELERAILETFDAHFAPDTLVSVRASTVGRRLEESEDSAQNPFAGMSETFLYVPRAQVIEKLRLCWASGFSPESLVYRRAQRMDLMGFGVAVGVQEMVFGERSFVLFTCDPKAAARDAVIVAGHGIGEGIVQEKVPVDHYFVNGRTGEVRRELATKDAALALDSARGFGLARREVAPELRDAPCLSDSEVRELVEVGARIERLFGCPQDIEGTIVAGGRVHVLQARPIALDFRRLRVFTNANVTESFPGATTALTYSFARYFYRVIFHDCYRRLGVPARTLHDNHEVLDRMIAYLGGRVYYSLTSFYHLHSQSPLFPLFRAHWEKMMGFRTSYETAPKSAFGRLVERARLVARTAGAVVVVAYRYLTHEREVRRFHEWWEDLFAPLRGRTFEEEDPLVLESEFHRVWREVGRRWGLTLLNDTYLPMIYGAVEALFRRYGLDRDPTLLSDLLCGDDGLVSVEAILSAVRLAEIVRADPALARAVETRTAEELFASIEKGELPAGFCAAVRTHLERFGDRGLQELKIEQPSVRDEPWVLLRSVKEYARSGVSVDAVRAREKATRAAAEVRLMREVAWRPLRQVALEYLLGRLRTLTRNRENSRYCRSELFGFSKNVFRAIGRALVSRGVLRAADDVYHLTQDELFGYLDGTGVTEDLQALADVRRRELRAHAARETSVEITTRGPVRDNAIALPAGGGTSAAQGGELKGLGSSPGKARGRARVVIDPTLPIERRPGEDLILVARETDPGWLFLMLSAKGIVVERGSMLSHTAITGRKFGIPTIVSLPGATARIPDGALVEMDGASGIVTVLGEGGEAAPGDAASSAP